MVKKNNPLTADSPNRGGAGAILSNENAFFLKWEMDGELEGVVLFSQRPKMLCTSLALKFGTIMKWEGGKNGKSTPGSSSIRLRGNQF